MVPSGGMDDRLVGGRYRLVEAHAMGGMASIWSAIDTSSGETVAVKRLHRRFTAIRVTFIELARRAELAPARDERLFTSHLIDLVTSVLDAPLSEETLRLLETRKRSPR